MSSCGSSDERCQGTHWIRGARARCVAVLGMDVKRPQHPCLWQMGRRGCRFTETRTCCVARGVALTEHSHGETRDPPRCPGHGLSKRPRHPTRGVLHGPGSGVCTTTNPKERYAWRNGARPIVLGMDLVKGPSSFYQRETALRQVSASGAGFGRRDAIDGGHSVLALT